MFVCLLVFVMVVSMFVCLYVHVCEIHVYVCTVHPIDLVARHNIFLS